MYRRKIICFALITLSSFGFLSCKKDEDSRRKCEFGDIYTRWQSTDDISLARKEKYHLKQVKLTGHDITCFDEKGNITFSIFKDIDSLNLIEIESNNFHESDNCLSLSIPGIGVFDSLIDSIKVYDNGYFYCSDWYYGDAYFRTLNLNYISNIFEVAEKEFSSIENNEFDLRKIREENSSIEKWLDSIKEYIYEGQLEPQNDIMIDLEFPYSDNESCIFSASSLYDLDSAEYVFNTLDKIQYTFNGIETFNYDVERDSILSFSKDTFDSSYGYEFVMFGGTNYSKVGVKTYYGDYSTGEFKSLVTTYTISSSDGEQLYNYLFEKYFDAYYFTFLL